MKTSILKSVQDFKHTLYTFIVYMFAFYVKDNLQQQYAPQTHEIDCEFLRWIEMYPVYKNKLSNLDGKSIKWKMFISFCGVDLKF